MNDRNRDKKRVNNVYVCLINSLLIYRNFNYDSICALVARVLKDNINTGSNFGKENDFDNITNQRSSRFYLKVLYDAVK